MNSDEKLARVTYLPGVTPPAVAAEPSPIHAEPSPEPAEAPASDDWQAQEHRAENVSMHALTRRGMSRWELGEVLLSRDLDPCIVDAELDRLEGVGLIDDSALAETIVRTQHERKGLGRAALVAELRRRRIDQDAIDEALEQLDEAGERERAHQLAERRAAQLRGLDHETAVRRLSGYLQRKGYSAETVRGAVIAALPRQSSGVRFR
ncbi:MAG TPA: regulatory protein RecX [Terrimesophilobacter sp.]|nr:regulatory protein RecX [Terrimesophilobacter sp.]